MLLIVGGHLVLLMSTVKEVVVLMQTVQTMTQNNRPTFRVMHGSTRSYPVYAGINPTFIFLGLSDITFLYRFFIGFTR